MTSGNFDFERKLEHLTEVAKDGFCYLKMMIMIPRLCNISFEHFCVLVDKYKEASGVLPKAEDAVVELAVIAHRVEYFLETGSIETEVVTFDRNIFNRIMDTNCRFSVEHGDGIHHIGSFMYQPCQHEGVFCNHGFSSKYVVVAFGASGDRLGQSVVNLDNLFGTEEFEDSTVMPEDMDRLQSGIMQQNEMIDRLARENDLLRAPLHIRKDSKDPDSYERPIDMNDKVLDRLMTKLELLEKKINAGPSNIQTSSEDDIGPNDSRSQIDAAHKRYMKEGTVINTYQSGRSKLGTIVEVPRLQPKTDVVRGFLKTNEMIESEQKAMKSVNVINGLAKPFTNNRLNFLMHFNTAITTNMPIDSESGYGQSIIKILKTKARTPSEQLAKQILNTTFDFEECVIVANPFSLPFIEIGMTISDQCLASCFSLLDDELQRTWFESLKGLKIPKFHSRFQKYSESEICGISKEPRRPKQDRPKKPKSEISYVSRSSMQGSGFRLF